MKKIFYLSLMLLAFSCSRNEQENETAALRVQLASGIATKATMAGTDNENRINSMQVSVFKKSGNSFIFEAAATSSSSSATVSVTSGEKLIYAVVNAADDITSQSSQGAILSGTNYLKSNGSGNFIMAGQKPFTVTASQRSVSIPVSRVAARIRLGKVTNSLSSVIAGKNVKLKSIYLTGVSAQSSYEGDGSASCFYATTGTGASLDKDGSAVTSEEKTAVNALIMNSNASGVIAPEASFQADYSLYAYPNDGASRKTHLVLEVEIDGKLYTYPIVFDSIAANSTYEISELKIKSLGNPSNGDDTIDQGEDDPVQSAAASFGIEVQPWNIFTVSNGEDGKYTI
ncbi:MAG: hypothetical protein J5835_02390 [Bacteroidales bacterium]|nr:hypothetical protein [Bacteroidales bacterium]